jgi:hypothetical protein
MIYMRVISPWVKKYMKFKLFSLRRIAHFPSELFWRGALCDNKNCHVPESITNPENISWVPVNANSGRFWRMSVKK